MAQLRTVAFQYSDGSAKFDAETKNFETKDATIRPIRQKDWNTSLRTIAETLSTSPETVRAHISRIDYNLKTLRWIPHTLM
jgi:hypothetical protein